MSENITNTESLILASGSPRRSELLGEIGVSFQVQPSQAEELHDVTMPLVELCEHNARLKAQDVAKDHPGRVVLGADTLVYIDETPLGKPKTQVEAVATLQKLSGRAHQVCTALCLVSDETVTMFHEVTDVVFQSLSDTRIREYIGKVDVMDKAGSYAIQEHGDMIIESIQGDYSNVVGLPQALVIKELEKLRIHGKLA